MASATKAVLLGLCEDPICLERFKKDPTSVMNEFNVSARHQELILSGDRERLAQETGMNSQKMMYIIL